MTTAIKYAGRCCGCGIAVAAGEGYYNGGVWCEMPKRGYDFEPPFTASGNVVTCKRDHERIAIAHAKNEAKRIALEATPEYQAELAARKEAAAIRSAERAKVIHALALRGLKECRRCGGAGHAEQWRHTGYACYDCQGSGTVPMTEREVKAFQNSLKASA